jgi:hypothetical protein
MGSGPPHGKHEGSRVASYAMGTSRRRQRRLSECRRHADADGKVRRGRAALAWQAAANAEEKARSVHVSVTSSPGISKPPATICSCITPPFNHLSPGSRLPGTLQTQGRPCECVCASECMDRMLDPELVVMELM